MEKQVKEIQQLVIGINSNSLFNGEENKHFLFMDFDDIEPSEQYCYALMKKHGISQLQVWESSPEHWWITSFCEFSLKEMIKIVASDPFVDKKFISCLLSNFYATLRVTPKLYDGKPFRPIDRRYYHDLSYYGLRKIYNEAYLRFKEIIEQEYSMAVKPCLEQKSIL